MSATTGKSRGRTRSASEWVAFGIASSVLLLIVGSVASVWVRDDGSPVRLAVRQAGAVRHEGSQYYVESTVTNSGDRTAEGVQVHAELTRDGEVVEDADQTIDFLAGGESEQVVFVFSEDPASGELTLRAASYVKP